MLTRQARTDQRWTFGGWSGTPRQLADLAAAAQNLLPDTKFKATITHRDGSVQEADAPDDLAGLVPDIRPKSAEIKLSVVRGDSADQLHAFSISIQIWGAWNYVSCSSPTELETGVMVDTMKQAIRPRVPIYARLNYHAVVIALSLIAAGLIAAAAYRPLSDWVPNGAHDEVLFGLFLIWISIFFVMSALMDRLLPEFEVHGGKTRVRRFGGWVAGALLLPLLLPWVVELVRL